jgi:hypothetical protein
MTNDELDLERIANRVAPICMSSKSGDAIYKTIYGAT